MLHTLEMAHVILDALPLGVFWKDKNSVYLGCNQWISEYTGVSPRDIVGKTDYDLCWAAMADKYRQDDHNVVEHHQKFEGLEETITSHDGSERWGKVTKIPLMVNGEVIGILGFWQDLTELSRFLDVLSNGLVACADKMSKINQKLNQ